MKFELVDTEFPAILSHVSIARQTLSLAPQLMQEASNDLDAANMFMRLFYLFQGTQQDDFSLLMQEKALKVRQVYKILLPNQNHDHKRIKLLALYAPGDMRENLPIDYLVESLNVDLEILYLLPNQAFPQTIPKHDVAIVAMGQSSNNRPLLESLEKVFDSWPRPIINRPKHILKCARDLSAQLLNGIEGLVVAQNTRTHRSGLFKLNHPFTIRPIDSHAGDNFCLITCESELQNYLALNEDSFFYSGQFIDYKSKDGLFRKFRVALIEGVPYICHLAITDNWVVHYMKAEMHLNQSKRDEEEEFMNNFQRTFAHEYAPIFKSIYERLPLEYVVLDCAIDNSGNLVIFELDNSGWVHDTDPQDIYPYKNRIMQIVFNAFEELLTAKLNSHPL